MGNIKHTQGSSIAVICNNCEIEKKIIARRPLPRLKCRKCGGKLTLK